MDPVTGNQSTVIAQLYSLFGVAILIAIGGDAWIIKGLGRTYDAVPMLDAPAIGSMVEGAQVAFSGIFVSAFMIGAPVIIALIITDAAFGVVSRVVPQMNIFAVGFPAKMIVGLVLLGASLPFVSGFFVGSLQDSVAEALHFLKVGRSAMANDKTEKATPKKKEDARKKGQVAKSADINGAAILLAGLIALSAAGPKAMEQMKIAMLQVIDLMAHPQVVDREGVGNALHDGRPAHRPGDPADRGHVLRRRPRRLRRARSA